MVSATISRSYYALLPIIIDELFVCSWEYLTTTYTVSYVK